MDSYITHKEPAAITEDGRPIYNVDRIERTLDLSTWSPDVKFYNAETHEWEALGPVTVNLMKDGPRFEYKGKRYWGHNL